MVLLENLELDFNTITNTCNLCKVANPKKVIFLNVVKDFNIPESVAKEFPELLNNALTDREKAIKQVVVDNFTCNTSYDTLVRQGNELKELLNVASTLKSDLIIVGKRKNSDSVLATRIARRSPCNLLIVPETSSLDFSSFLIPVDFSDYSLLSIDQALSLAGEKKSKLFLQNVYQVPSSYRYSGKNYEEFAQLMEEHAENDLKSILQHIRPGNYEIEKIFTLEKGGTVMGWVYQEAKRRKANLIVMGAKGKTTASAFFIGSKSERMIKINNTIPLLIIRKKGDIEGLIDSFIDK